jgi:uncharacterized protein YkwD
MMRRPVWTPWLTLPLLGLLGACGGGDGGGAVSGGGGAINTAPAGAAVAPAAVAPVQSAATPAAALTDCSLPAFAADLLQLINAQRARGASCGSQGNFAAAPALAWNAALAAAASGQARDMAAGNFLSHTGSDGITFDQRISAAGYAWRTAAENIAFGYPSVSAVVAGWMASDGHCANLMSGQMQDIGGACAPASADGRFYWVVDLGHR